MAEAQAGHSNAQQEEQIAAEQEERQQSAGGEANEEKGKEQEKPGRVYTQDELDRILNKVRKNARYLGRKEAEAEMVRQGASPRQAEQAVDRQEQQLKPPKREDFEHYEDYLDAKADFRARTATREEREAGEKAARERRVSEERQRIEREFSKHAKAVIGEHPEMAERIEAADGVQMSVAMGDAIKEAGRLGIFILDYLVQHPEESERIANLESKPAQSREIGKLEAKIEAELAAKKKPKDDDKSADEYKAGDEDKGGEDDAGAEGKGEGERNSDGTFKPKKKPAPDPIEPGTGRSANQDRGPTDKDSDAGWYAKRLAEEKAERDRARRK